MKKILALAFVLFFSLTINSCKEDGVSIYIDYEYTLGGSIRFYHDYTFVNGVKITINQLGASYSDLDGKFEIHGTSLKESIIVSFSKPGYVFFPDTAIVYIKGKSYVNLDVLAGTKKVKVSGRVYDKNTNLGMKNIKIKNSSDFFVNYAVALTNEDGNYSFNSIAGMNIYIKPYYFSNSLFEPGSRNFTLGENDTSGLDFKYIP